jgi:hypothetical protein
MSPLSTRNTRAPAIASSRYCSKNGGGMQSMAVPAGIASGSTPQRQGRSQETIYVLLARSGAALLHEALDDPLQGRVFVSNDTRHLG